MMKSIKKRILGFSNNEKGFTLIEIIAVLVILGILAAVAIPKFTNLQEQARLKSAQSGIAEFQSRAAQEFANQLLAHNGNLGNTTATSVNDILTLQYGMIGDYNVDGVLDGLTGITFTVDIVQGVDLDVDATGSWVAPIP